jgi:hypothetical protein
VDRLSGEVTIERGILETVLGAMIVVASLLAD